MYKNLQKYFLLFLITSTLSACASGSRPEKMSVVADPSLSAPAKFANKISLAEISGGKETNPLLVSKVDNKSFTDALRASLLENGYLDESGNGRYALNAELLGLEQPMIGFSFTVDSIVGYKLTDTRNNSVVYDKTIKSAGTATMGDSVLGVERLRISNEYSIQNNFKEFLKALSGKEEPTS